MREKIVISNIDLNILHFLKEERFVKDLIEEFGGDYLFIKNHTNRLKQLDSYDEIRFGTFKKLKINKKGEEILKVLLWK